MHTIRGHEGDVTQLGHYCAGKGLDAPARVGLTGLRGWLARMQAAGAGSATLQRCSAAVRVFFDWAVREQVVHTNPATALMSPKVPRRLPPHLSASDMDEIFAAASALGCRG